jgi:hypothetical protein
MDNYIFVSSHHVADDKVESGAGFVSFDSDEDNSGEPAQQNGDGGDNIDEDVSSHPVVPFVGMVFDNEDDAMKLYNEYACKMGFNTRICSSK